MRRFLVCVISVCLLSLATAFSRQQRPADPQQSAIPALAKAHIGALFPRISPDGERIVCSYQGAIWRVSRTGGVMSRLTSDSGFDIEPVWSLDGKQIAYVNSPNFGPGELRLVDSENGQPNPLPKRVEVQGTNIFQKLEFLSETRVLGVLRVDGQSLGLGWFDIKTGETKSLFNPPRWGRYALSSDRQRLAYSSTLDSPTQQMGNDGRQNDLWQIPVDGGQPQLITRFPSRVHDLCWSADDQGLFVVSELGGAHNDLWYVPLANPEQGQRRITAGQADEDRPSVSKNGRWLAFSDNQRSTTSIIVRDLQTETDQAVVIEGLEYRQPTGKLTLSILDRTTRKPMTARVSVLAVDGKLSAPAGALYRILGDVPHFYHSEDSSWNLPTGKYLLRISRGPEYRMLRLPLEIQAGEEKSYTAELERWADPTSDGWYSGENHIHANYGYGQWYNTAATMFAQCSGEDLHVCNLMVANSDTDGVFDREHFRGRLDPLSTSETLLYWNQEFRSTIWGHMTLLNLKQVVEPVFTGFKDTTNPWDIPTNSDIADRTHWQQGVVNYTHVAQNADDPYDTPYSGKGIPVDVALGKIDTLDLNASYSGTVPLWYRLLNCGFRLPASAGTDTFLNRVNSRLPGGDRVYVKLKGPLTYEGWIAGLKAGRSFVSNGPLLEFALENSTIGDTLTLDATRTVRVRASVKSQFPMQKFELIYNGKVVLAGDLNNGRTFGTLDSEIKLDRSGWLSCRASGPGHQDHPNGTLDAHTSPIYVTVAGKPTASKADAECFVKWIDRLSLAIRVRDRIPNDQLRKQVQDQFEAARAIYLKIAESAE
jgi:TolB protein